MLKSSVPFILVTQILEKGRSIRRSEISKTQQGWRDVLEGRRDVLEGLREPPYRRPTARIGRWR